jgi:hypothetical protein
MTKWLVVLVVALGAGVGAAQPAAETGSASGSGAGSGSAAQLRQICTDAMNGDPSFAQAIAATVDKQLDQKTIDLHQDAEHHIEKNERHVIIAYAAMWIIAALFVIFLWRRQQLLVVELGKLRAELEAAGKESA